MTFRQSVWHQIVDWSRYLGLRDRLRCPACKAVGTWKPHGGWADGDDQRKVRRWMCKWCGFYLGPEPDRWVCVGPTAWAIPSDIPRPHETPKMVVERHFDRPISPWAG